MSKQIKILFFVLFISFSSYSQQFLFKTTGFTVMEKNNKGQWGDWSKFIESEMMIKVDGINHRVVVYSEVIQLFNILKYNDKVSNETDEVVSLNCVDNEGLDCNVSIFTRKKQGNRMQMYITYDDMIIAYNIVLQKDTKE